MECANKTMANYQLKITIQASRLPDPIPEPISDPGRDPMAAMASAISKAAEMQASRFLSRRFPGKRDHARQGN
jgi:hypothetical protein